MNKRAIIADDDPIVCHLLSAILESQGFEVKTVGLGSDLLKELDESQGTNNLPDILFLDAHLPDANAHELLMNLPSSEEQRIRVILVSANTRDELLQEYPELKADFFLEKPFTSETTALALRSVLGTD